MFRRRHRKSHQKFSGDCPHNSVLLSEMKEGQSGTIVEIAGGIQASKRLADLGLSPGAEVEILSSTYFSGPIQILVCGSKLVLGRGLAAKIIVAVK